MAPFKVNVRLTLKQRLLIESCTPEDVESYFRRGRFRSELVSAFPEQGAKPRSAVVEVNVGNPEMP